MKINARSADLGDPFQLRSIWMAYAGLSGVGSSMAYALLNDTTDGVGLAFLVPALAGVMLGLYERYFSGFSVGEQLVRVGCLALLMCVILPADAAMAIARVVLKLPVPMSAVAIAVGVIMLVALGAGASRVRRTVRDHRSEAEPAWLRARVDVAAGLLLGTPAAAPATFDRQTGLALLLIVLAVNIPLFFAAPEIGRGLILLLISPALFVAFAQIGYLVGQTFTLLLEIHRWERVRGVPLVSARLGEVRALRQRFWVVRLFACLRALAS